MSKTMFIYILATWLFSIIYVYTWIRNFVSYLRNIFVSGNPRETAVDLSPLRNFYNRTEARSFMGIYLLHRPVLVINNYNRMRDILPDDMGYLYGEEYSDSSSSDPFCLHLLAMNGLAWERLQRKLSPTHISTRLKATFPTLLSCATAMIKRFESNGLVVNTRNILANYCICVFSSCSIGINLDAYMEFNSDYRYVRNVKTNPSVLQALKQFLTFSAPNFISRFNIIMTPKEIEEFFIDIVKWTIVRRHRNDDIRTDLAQLIVELYDNGNGLMVPEVAAHIFNFFIGGYESLSAIGAFLLYELAKNPGAQTKLIDHIDIILIHNEGKITYDLVCQIPYLDWALEEIFRMYPSIPYFFRSSAKNNSRLATDKEAQAIIIPAMVDQSDSEISNFLDFKPERFRPTSANKRQPYSSLPFGNMAGFCIGNNLLELKLAIVSIFSKFSVTLCKRTSSTLEFNPMRSDLSPSDEIYIHFKKRPTFV